jgi:hypothetical protein
MIPVDLSLIGPRVQPAADPEAYPRYVPMSEQQRWYSPTPRTVPATSQASRPLHGLPVSPAAMEASMTAAYEDWGAAGKPCLRQSCGHRHGDHIPSEAMECDVCDCLGFVGFPHVDDAAVMRTSTVSSAVDPDQRAKGNAMLTASSSLINPPQAGPGTGFREFSPTSRECRDHDRDSC